MQERPAAANQEDDMLTMRFEDVNNVGYLRSDQYEDDHVEDHPSHGRLLVEQMPSYADRCRWNFTQLLPGNRGATRKRFLGQILRDDHQGGVWWATPCGVRRSDSILCKDREEALRVIEQGAPEWKPRNRKK